MLSNQRFRSGQNCIHLLKMDPHSIVVSTICLDCFVKSFNNHHRRESFTIGCLQTMNPQVSIPCRRCLWWSRYADRLLTRNVWLQSILESVKRSYEAKQALRPVNHVQTRTFECCIVASRGFLDTAYTLVSRPSPMIPKHLQDLR